MSDVPSFSIIIPFKTWSLDLDECLSHIRNLSFQKYEVILLPDGPIDLPESFSNLPLEIISTGEVNPAIKRDIGADKAKGEFLAFIDDDAYPQSDWLDTAFDYFSKHPEAGAIGGPAITPKNDPFWARVSGAVWVSVMRFPLRSPCPWRWL